MLELLTANSKKPIAVTVTMSNFLGTPDLTTYGTTAGCRVFLGDHLYMLGGRGTGANGDLTSNTKSFKYNFITKQFTTLPNNPYYGIQSVPVVIGTTIYVVNQISIYKFDTLTNTFSMVYNNSPNVGNKLTIGALGNKLYIFSAATAYSYNTTNGLRTNLTGTATSIFTTLENRYAPAIAYGDDTLTWTQTRLNASNQRHKIYFTYNSARDMLYSTIDTPENFKVDPNNSFMDYFIYKDHLVDINNGNLFNVGRSAILKTARLAGAVPYNLNEYTIGELSNGSYGVAGGTRFSGSNFGLFTVTGY